MKIGAPDSGSVVDYLTAPVLAPPDEDVILECWGCGRTRNAGKAGAFSLGEQLESAGWGEVFDFKRRRRKLVCSEKCRAAIVRTDGVLQRRPR